MNTTHQIGDRVNVLHNLPLGNLTGTIKAIHARPKHDVYEVDLDGGGTDQLYDFQLKKIPDHPQTGGDTTEILNQLMAVKAERDDLKTERGEILEQVNNLGKYIGRPGMTAAHIVSRAVSKIEKLEAECARLHLLWHSAEQMLSVEKADSLRSSAVKICATITGHTPRELCTTEEAVQWLVDRHKSAAHALYVLEEIRTEKLAAKGLAAEASAVSDARVILQSKRIADEMADGTSERPAENADVRRDDGKGIPL